MLIFSISYCDLMNFHYFATPLKEGIRGEREGDFTHNFNTLRFISLDLKAPR
jgi:hypothetical protein